MNFIRGRVEAGAVTLGDYRFVLPDSVLGALRTDASDVLVGLRPEEFADARLAGDGDRVMLPAEIEITEQLGPETYAYFRVPSFDVVELGDRPVELGGALSARLDPHTSAEAGERLDLSVNLEGVHLFDLETGQSLIGG